MTHIGHHPLGIMLIRHTDRAALGNMMPKLHGPSLLRVATETQHIRNKTHHLLSSQE